MRTRNHRLAASAAIVALAVASTAANAELTSWDQEQVTSIAGELAKATDAAYDHVYKQPQLPGDRKLDDMQKSLRGLRTQARALSGNLEKGKGRDGTTNIYKHIMVLWRNIQDDARQSFETSPVSESLARVETLLNQIGPYYDADWNKSS